jgi:hypothetical protein
VSTDFAYLDEVMRYPDKPEDALALKPPQSMAKSHGAAQQRSMPMISGDQ